MAADCSLAERRIVEIKMGRSKFPGKPSKIGNRKRVNLSSCALPEENESSKAAENIYLGLSMFNEAFGDNEMIPIGPFQGFSAEDVEDALAEARLQQRESETEYKKQGINVNLQDSFQSELISILGSFNLNGNHDKNKTRLCFDGGGLKSVENTDVVKSGDSKPSNTNNKVTSNLHNKSEDKVNHIKCKNNYTKRDAVTCKTIRTVDSRRNIFKSSRVMDSMKSLQSRAAKKLLQKAKLSNLSDINKNNTSDRKFVLPTYSMHSLRMITPNKRFFQDSDTRKERLRAKFKNNASQSGKIMCKTKYGISLDKELRVEITDFIGKKNVKEEVAAEQKITSGKESNDKIKSSCSSDPSKTNTHYTSTGKLILREPKLQLNRINLGLMEGPFSSSSQSSSLSPNSQLNTKPAHALKVQQTIECSVCGSVKFYKFVDLAKKFGVYCCKQCQKFITKIIKSVESEKSYKLQCLKRKGLCWVQPFLKSQHTGSVGIECQACWLMLCLKNCKISRIVKTKLVELLPADMQLNINLESPIMSKEGNKLGIYNNNSEPFKWLSCEESKSENGIITRSSKTVERTSESKSAGLVDSSEKSLTKENRSERLENKRRLLRHKTRAKTFAEDGNRQRIALKGPRVKNVCRSASVVLGQPIATFPREASPKKQSESSQESVKNCDKLDATNGCRVDSQGVLVDKCKEVAVSDRKQLTDKKSGVGSKQIGSVKPSPAQQRGGGGNGSAIGRTKKADVKTENPVSIDFWETYDPDEICETGFGLIGSKNFSVRALCFLCGSAGQEKLIHCASCCEPYHEFCVNEEQVRIQDDAWKYDWICPRCTVCATCGKTSGQQLKCVKCDNSYHTECVDRVGGRLLYSPDRPWVCSVCLRCKSCNGVDVSVFVGNLPLCRACFVLRQKGNYCPLCQRCYEDDDYDSKMMECGQCKCWVHAKCEGLSDEKYQVLSFLPESVEYVCRVCCVMPPAPWWIAVEAELKSGYLGVLKALSKNRKACAMLKWSPRKQCTCRQVNCTPRAIDFEETKAVKQAEQSHPKGENDEKPKGDAVRPAPVLERKTSIEVINHANEGSLKLTLKIMKGPENGGKSEGDDGESEVKMKEIYEKFNIKECSVRVKKCPSNEDLSSWGSPEDSQQPIFKTTDFAASNAELPDKRSLSSPLNPPSDSGIGSTDDELKANSLTDEESCRLEDQHPNRFMDSKTSNEQHVAFFEDKNECVCFLEVDSYNSRSKPFSPSLLSIKKKVVTSEYSSLQQFHMDMQRMIATTQSTELMEMYHQTVKEIFPWFDPKFSRVYTNSQKISGTTSVESTPVKSTPSKSIVTEDCKVPRDCLIGQPLDYYYSGYSLEDDRSCLMCKGVGDGRPNETGRLLYCGQNEWVHCNCALWSAEVFEEIDGSLQNVHSAISRGRSIRCPECNMKGASIGCCARNCAETFHFPCARKVGCTFMDDKTVFCPAHSSETKGKLVQNEKEFEIRRPVYVELDKRRMKTVDSSQVRFAVGGLHIENLGRFIMKLSDYPEGITPDQFQCTRLFWSCYEPWKIVRYHFSVRVQEDEQPEGVDFGVNLTIDHSNSPEVLELKLKQLQYFQEHQKLLEIEEPSVQEGANVKRKLNDMDGGKTKSDDQKCNPAKKSKKDKITKKIVDLFDAREDESCLSDSQNTVDLIPPELEEAIFKDLRNDILDGISMQDIFMDIKADMYDGGDKVENSLEVEEIIPIESKPKKADGNGESQNEVWAGPDESKQNVYEWTDETSPKSNRDLKRSRSDVVPGRRNMTLKSNQRSCSLNWNCKMDIHTSKWKRNEKCHSSVNLLEPQERGNMLQELKFTDSLVMVSTDSLPSVKDLKDRLVIQQEEGKENKCLPWHMKMQPRLLQVDGGVDSSSSGSEAGESPQRLMEENLISTRNIPPPQPSPFSSNTPYADINTQFATSSQTEYPYSSFNLPQIDGMDDNSSDGSDFECFKSSELKTRQYNFKITQLDGSADTESECQINDDDRLSPPLSTTSGKDEPVKCPQCKCTYRTKISYERHLESCCNDYILFSSDGEGSEEETPFHVAKTEVEPPPEPLPPQNTNAKPIVKTMDTDGNRPNVSFSKIESTPVKTQTKKGRKPQVKRKVTQFPSVKKHPIIAANQSVQQIFVQQSPVTPTMLVQDIPQPNIVPGAFIDTGGGIQYVAPLESQNAFTKPQLIATPSPIVPGGFHIQTQESQLISSLPVISQNVPANLPGIIIQQPQVAGTLISPQPAPVVMSGDQMMLGAAPLLEVIHDPQTGGMFLASHNQPVFYNMETIVSNTVMQTNQYVSNVMTASSFSQTSTQVVQTSKLEQVVNVPSNFILVGQNSSSDKIIPSSDLVCLPAPQPLMPSQSTMQTVVNPILHASQTFNPEPKIMPPSVNPTVRCIQPIQSKPITALNNVPPVQALPRTTEPSPRIVKCYRNNPQTKQTFRSMPMMRPNVTKSPPREYEKAVIEPKPQKHGSRPIIESINFKSTPEKIPTVKEEVPHPSEPPASKKDVVLPQEEKQLEIPEMTNEPVSLPVVDVPPTVPLIEPEVQSSEDNKDAAVPMKAETEAEPHIKPEIMDVDVKVELEESEENKTVDEPSPEENRTEEIVSDAMVEADAVVEAEVDRVENANSVDAVHLKMEEEPVSSVEEPDILDKIDPVDSEDSKSAEEPERPDQEPNCVSSPEAESPADILPLQESSPSTTNTPAVKETSPGEENFKEKKLFTSNQNCVATKLVTIHPRLIQSPEYEAETENKKKLPNGKSDDKGPKLIFDVISDDGFKSSSTSMAELWARICDSVQEMRAVFKIPPLPISRKGHEILGMQNHGLQHCLEQLRGVEHCVKYKCKYFVKERSQKTDDRLTPVKENLSGCARTETYCDRKEYDMFAWLASRHRRLPKLNETSEEVLSTARRANSLPMAMRYRHLRETAKTYVGVYRSKIHGKGLFCLKEIEAGEMVIEYAGEVIRSNITDKREKYYTDKGIGCYMFRIDDHFVVDATMKGNAARFINHSCEPNCYSRVVDILGKKHIVIFALRRIHVMEELTYDYKFPFEDEKISCHCLSKKCRKYLN